MVAARGGPCRVPPSGVGRLTQPVGYVITVQADGYHAMKLRASPSPRARPAPGPIHRSPSTQPAPPTGVERVPASAVDTSPPTTYATYSALPAPWTPGHLQRPRLRLRAGGQGWQVDPVQDPHLVLHATAGPGGPVTPGPGLGDEGRTWPCAAYRGAGGAAGGRNHSDTWVGCTVRPPRPELGGEGVQVDLVAQPTAERRDGSGRVIAAAVEAPVHQVLDSAAQRRERRGGARVAAATARLPEPWARRVSRDDQQVGADQQAVTRA